MQEVLLHLESSQREMIDKVLLFTSVDKESLFLGAKVPADMISANSGNHNQLERSHFLLEAAQIVLSFL